MTLYVPARPGDACRNFRRQAFMKCYRGHIRSCATSYKVIVSAAIILLAIFVSQPAKALGEDDALAMKDLSAACGYCFMTAEAHRTATMHASRKYLCHAIVGRYRR